MASELEHILGIVNSFIHHRYRARLRLKPEELVDDLFHNLPAKLDPRYVVSLARRVTTAEELLSVLQAAKAADSAWVLGGFSGQENGPMALGDAVGAVSDGAGGAVASIEVGQLVLYKPEAYGSPMEQFLLVRDPKRKAAIESRLAALASGKRMK